MRHAPSADPEITGARRVVTITSLLHASPGAVWAQVSTMRGVNEELAPWLRMTCPEGVEDRSLSPEDTGHPLFTSTLCLLRWIPYDRHALRLTRVVPERGFLEESTSWTMRIWRHERTLTPSGDGVEITDRVTFEPRIPGVSSVVEPVVRAVFRHRHAVLRARFGGH